jgi:anti-sigma B factor antagonist
VNDWEAAFDRTETDAGPVLVVKGEIDLSVATRFAGALESLVGGADPTPVVDLGGVGFIDSAGVRELLKAQRTAQEHGADLVLRSPSDACRRVLQLSGVWAEFTIADAV